MVWHSKYETGNEQIDNQHKEIFGLVDKLVEASSASPDEIKDAIDFLVNYTATHFAYEEKLMDESAYPMAQTHKKQHSNFVATVGALEIRVLKETNMAFNMTDIKHIVVNWLVDHVLGSDKSLADHYRKWVK